MKQWRPLNALQKLTFWRCNSMYIRKTVDRWDARARVKEYIENGPGRYRLEKHRERKVGTKNV